MKITAGAYTSKGSVRSRNEDAYLCAHHTGGGGTEDSCVAYNNAECSDVADTPLFFLVADGMGGHDAGDVASAFVAEKMRSAAETAANENYVFDEASLEALVKSVHAELLQKGKEQGTPNMGSTLTGILLQKNAACAYFNAGDSRVYRLRNGFMQQLSRDDSLSSVVVGAAKNIITNAVGAGLKDVSVASRFSQTVAVAGDVFLMCSDGVHGFISDDDLETMLTETSFPQETPLSETAKRIVETAIANNSDDNCTAVLVRLVGE